MSPIISAVVCTHNRALSLEQTLISLLAQALPKDEYEIIVVDNASTDETASVVRAMREANSNLQYLHEPKIGLSHARNAGIQSASGDYIAFLDDDELVPRDWLTSIITTFETVCPAPDICGGIIDLNWECERPAWLSDHLLVYLGKFNYGNKAFFINSVDSFLGGGNIAIKKSVIATIGRFDLRLGRTGNDNMGNEEVDLQCRALDHGLVLYYNPEIRVFHYVPADRCTKTWHYERFYFQGVSSAKMGFLRCNTTSDYLRLVIDTGRSIAYVLLMNYVRRNTALTDVEKRCNVKYICGFCRGLFNSLRNR